MNHLCKRTGKREQVCPCDSVRCGKSLCSHGRQKHQCLICIGTGICVHKTRRHVCRVCTPFGWAKRNLKAAQEKAKKLFYKPPFISLQGLIDLTKNSKVCFLCGGPLDWSDKRTPHLHHNHNNGKVLGFTHPRCNRIEGMLGLMRNECRKKFLRMVQSADSI